MNHGKALKDATSVSSLTQQEVHYTNLASLPSSMLNSIECYSNISIIISGMNDKMLFISRNIESLLGFEKNELLGLTWYEFLTPEYVNYLKKIFSEHIEPGIEQVFNVNVRDKEGKYVWFECTVTKIVDEEEYFLCSLKDIPNKTETEEMMIQSEKMSVAGQLAAGIAHEIRNPLTSIKGFLQLLQAGVNQKDVYYKIMRDEIDKIEAITSELLFLSKPITNKRNIESVNSMIQDVLLLLKSQAKLNNIDFDWHSQKELFIHCDRSQFKQVLINLVKNAIEATESNGIIKVSVKEKERFVEIDIVDEGPGIPQEIIDKIGHPFFTTKQGGTGLGLMITKRILDQHEAILRIIQNENEGSTFRILIPMNGNSSL